LVDKPGNRIGLFNFSDRKIVITDERKCFNLARVNGSLRFGIFFSVMCCSHFGFLSVNEWSILNGKPANVAASPVATGTQTYMKETI
jgi:hypothetical protein